MTALLQCGLHGVSQAQSEPIDVVPAGAAPGRVTAIAIEPSSRRAVTAGTDASVKVWDLDRKSIIRSIDNVGYFPQLILMPDGDHILTTAQNDPSVKLWDLRTGRLQQSFTVSATINKSAFVLSSTGKHLFVSGGAPGLANYVGEIIDLSRGGAVVARPLMPIEGTGKTMPILYGAFSPDGSRFFGSNLCWLGEYSVDDGSLIRTLRPNSFFKKTCDGGASIFAMSHDKRHGRANQRPAQHQRHEHNQLHQQLEHAPRLDHAYADCERRGQHGD
jgi:WD40 repeat protein